MTYGKRVHNSLVSHAFTRPSNRDVCSPRSRGLAQEITRVHEASAMVAETRSKRLLCNYYRNYSG